MVGDDRRDRTAMIVPSDLRREMVVNGLEMEWSPEGGRFNGDVDGAESNFG